MKASRQLLQDMRAIAGIRAHLGPGMPLKLDKLLTSAMVELNSMRLNAQAEEHVFGSDDEWEDETTRGERREDIEDRAREEVELVIREAEQETARRAELRMAFYSLREAVKTNLVTILKAFKRLF